MRTGDLCALFRLASELGNARKRGDLEEIERLEEMLKIYERIMLECDVVVMGNLTRGDLDS